MQPESPREEKSVPPGESIAVPSPWWDYDTMHELFVERELTRNEIARLLGISWDTADRWIDLHDLDECEE